MRSRVHPEQADSHKILPRRMDFVFDDAIPKYWYDGDPFKTLLLSALSCSFPEGERFFIQSVRQYQDKIASPELQQRVRGFIGQEAHHGREHDGFNAMMNRKGLPMAKIESFVREGLAYQKKILSPERQLAKTCALEHFTAMLAEVMLKHPELLDGVDERLRPLWLWHAVEESEHKAVAFDVYQRQIGSYWVRTSEMAMTTMLFSFFTGLHTVQLLHHQGELGNWRSIRKGMRRLAGPQGFFRGLLPRYLAYYRPDFHPDQVDSRALRDKGVAPAERGQPAKKSAKRSARQTRDTERGAARASPMQALKSAVKKAAAKTAKNGKPRKSRR